MGHAAYNKYVVETVGHFAVVRGCRLCKFYHSRPKGGRLAGLVGRGNGFREGNKQRGILIQHLKEVHPAEYAAAMAAGPAEAAAKRAAYAAKYGIKEKA